MPTILTGAMLKEDPNFDGILELDPVSLRSPSQVDSDETFDVPMMVVHDTRVGYEDKWVLIRSDQLGIFRRLSSHYSIGFNDVFKDVILNTKEGYILDARIALEDGRLYDRGRTWFEKYLTDARYFSGQNGEFILKNCYRNIMYITGKNIVSFMQRITYEFGTTEAYDPYFKLEGVQKVKIRSFIEEDLPTIKDNVLPEDKLRADVLCSILYQMESVFPYGFARSSYAHVEIAISDSFTSLHDDKYTIKRIIEVLSDLNPDLSRTTHFSLEFGEVQGQLEFSSVKLHHINAKTFYSAWLEAIKKHLANIPVGQSKYFEGFRNLFMDSDHPNDPNFGAKFSEIDDPNLEITKADFVVDKNQGLDDYTLRRQVNDALLNAIGNPALAVLKAGLGTLLKTDDDKVIMHFVTHDPNLLSYFMSKMNMRLPISNWGVIGRSSFPSAGDLINKIPSLFISGHYDTFTVKKIDNGKVDNLKYNIDILVKPTSLFLKRLFNNVRLSHNNRYHSVLRYLFLQTFYNTFNSRHVQNEFFTKGRILLNARFKEMIIDQVNLYTDDEFYNYFKDEIEMMKNIAEARGEIISKENLISIKRMQIINYLVDHYTNLILYPSAMPSPSSPTRAGDIALFFQSLLIDPSVQQIEIPFIKSGGTSRMNTFFANFRLKLSLGYFSSKDILNILPTLAYKYHNLNKGQTYLGDETVFALRSIEYILPDLREGIEETYYLFLEYFDDYIKITGNNKFTVQFLDETAMGLEHRSYLKYTVPSHRLTNELRQLLEGRELGFMIDNENNLRQMVGHIVLYMVLFDCIATVREVSRDLQGELVEKYCLIASTSGIISNNYLRHGIATSKWDLYLELSNGLKGDLSGEYLILAENLKVIWSKLKILKPYLFTDNQLIIKFFREFLGIDIKELVSINRSLKNWDELF